MRNLNQYVLNLQAGKDSAIQFFVDEFSQTLMYFAFKLVKDKNIAEEIASDAFLKLWERRVNFHSYESIQSFLFLVTRNACLDNLKQFKNRFQHDASFLTDLEDEDPDILTKIIQIELIAQIAQEIEKLPTQQRQVAQLSLLEGKDTDEICTELDTTSSTVYFSRSKAMSALRLAFKRKNISY